MAHPTKIIVLDDDPTGSQTVHSCLLLTCWDVPTLTMGLADSSPIMFILTNTRALPADQAESVTKEACQNLKIALLDQPNVPDFLVVSRSDSTLRGHYPIETDAIATALGPFDAHFLVPAFLEGGRITRDSIHYLKIDGKLTPVHETEFAQDSVFAYHHSYLPDYVAEKTQGRIPADRVEQFLLKDIRQGIQPRLAQLQGNICGVVDAETQGDLDRFAEDVLAVAATGKRFLFRSAASLLTALAQLPPQPIPAESMGQYRRSSHPGVIVVGSHVQKTTEQLTCLLGDSGVVGIELAVAELVDNGDAAPELIQDSLGQITRVFEAGQTPVLFTSRQELQFADTTTRLAFGLKVSEVLMAIVRELPPQISFLISKGGITSNDVLSTGLNLPTARLLGQILPGCSVVRTGLDHPRFPELPVVLFPGNVGDRQGLLTVYKRLMACDLA
ncbi:four-carbon acid sugar kinase family protein [Candidatus Synechococcus calcipolaris G9]|uniref:Four-carbon acid sugar kinase family protein n=1 Tax=Candidatus Synechococcus calcipolaris G9 TaxID=1497997 RepID=A0ABT6EU99_9SYNE|nr:four-carbon acid sugar kinase family protein [Candidatus Synechococcus calcipolaris]MDG2989459.1 four-carbon acid sugar kinase family protein [Candidatus Synechococcus calcipolaris G9]